MHRIHLRSLGIAVSVSRLSASVASKDSCDLRNVSVVKGLSIGGARRHRRLLGFVAFTFVALASHLHALRSIALVIESLGDIAFSFGAPGYAVSDSRLSDSVAFVDESFFIAHFFCGIPVYLGKQNCCAGCRRRPFPMKLHQ